MARLTMQVRALLVVLAVTLSACGSTLPEDGGLPAQAQGDGLVVEDATGEFTSGGATTLSGGGATGTSVTPGRTGSGGTSTSGSGTTGGSVPSSSGGSTSNDGSAGTTGSSTAGAGSTTSTTPGTSGEATGEPVKVGVVLVNAAALFAVFSVEASGDPRQTFEAYEEWFNANGGFAGRPVDFYYEVVDVAEDQNAAAQRVCERFTQDNKMDLVYDAGAYPNAVLVACLAEHDLSVFAGARWTADEDVNKPNMFTTAGVRVDRYAGQWIDLAVQQGWIGAGDKLGVLYEDCPWGSRIYNNVSVPAAARHGIQTTHATVKCIENAVSDLGPITNQARSAALRFQSEFVTHVMVLSVAEGFVTGQFSRGAEDQQFRPTYITTTNVFPYNNSNPDTAVGFHPNQRPKVTGFGWVPLQDVGDEATDANAGQTQAIAQCREVDPTMGGADGFEEGTQDHMQYKMIFLEQCDALFALRAVASATGGDFRISALRGAWRGALSSIPSGLQTGGVHRVDAAGFDSVGLIRGYAFNPDDGRMSYVTSVLEIS